ncbi:PucR family transcriptional regulator [Aquibacillus salsiterrae]|uniref:PucR family transcriptional regulator ligand-binding domain-containing protein n=1 Tax=Aquibacillus salsiterrae TaxID=2950439 RepID=A0A9X4AET1_9BACI|nr:PucR family transcriptional regulator [Aquibacillus salsiterrae]MDC3416934.1 PucR family transcriptional regulator ligand-binding domain-containing protein [Aquibacillus salsiterrae]
MGLNAFDIVNLSILKTAKIKAGEYLLQNTSVEWISVIELPVENFVRKNEFVLTTGMGCENDHEQLEAYVRDIVQSGASILGIATGRYVFGIPEQVLKIAEENHLIIMDIPWEVRFADILQTVMEKITQDRQQERQHADEARRRLINCVLQDKGLKEIARVLYHTIQIPLAIIDESGVTRANQRIKSEDLQVYPTQKKTIKQQSTSHPSFSEHPIYYHMEAYHLNKQTFYQLNIFNNHKVQGYLVCQPANQDQLTWFVMNVLEHALTACALYFVKENAIELTEVKLKDNFVLTLAKQELPVNDQSLSKAKLLGYDLEHDYVCIVGDVTSDQASAMDKEDKPSNSSLQSDNYYIQKEIMYAGKLLERLTMTTFDNGQVIIYVEADHHPYMETANQFLDTISRRLSELLDGTTLSWGISTPKSDDNRFFEGYQEAKTALEIGVQQNGRGERTFFSNTKVNRLLMALSKEPEIDQIVNDTLDPLIEYDRKRQTDLIYTFLIYNKFKGNVSQAARALNLHRQSLLHRLRNIESLTKLSLVDSDDWFLLELSVRLWQLKNIH